MDQPQRLIHLVVTKGPDKGQMFFVKPKREALIGRSVACDLRLTDPSASQKHCLVRSAGDIVFIEDLGSRNGTSVNGARTSQRVLDENGRIEIGASVIEVTWVETEKSAPLAAVDSINAPTLLETNPSMKPAGRIAAGLPSTVLDASQTDDFRTARQMLGKTVGDFLILETLGLGDFGVIYRAKTVKSRKEVALAMIARAGMRNREQLIKFLRDIKTGLTIPHALTMLKVGETPEYGYIATELVKGRDLDTLLDAGRKFNAAQTVALLQPVCAALTAAHTAGLVHGDVRPANILLDENDRATLLGLGLPRHTDSEGKSIFAREALSQCAYLAPELTRADVPTPAADVFSLGATLFGVLTGQRPFEASSKIELVRRIRWDELPRLDTLNQEVPAPLAEAVARAMAKEPAGRFKDMPEFAAALQAAVK